MAGRISLHRKDPQLLRLEKRMEVAGSYDEWLDLASEYDQSSGANLWRESDASQLYDHYSIKARLQKLRRLRKKKDDQGLLFALNEGIHGNMAGMGHSALYRKARCGTKLLIEDYVNEIRDALEYLSPRRFKGIPWAERAEFFQRASHCYGRSALMLSGGGTLGYFHLGVVKTLIEQQLCPVVISGASAGSFVAAVAGTHSDQEYLDLFKNDHLAKLLTEDSDTIKIGFGNREPVDMGEIKRGIAKLVPDMTFLEAYEKTGRSINISISPSEPRQTSRLLNHIASPNVTIRSAVLASSALPGIFPPVQLQARNIDGEVQPYLPSRRWIDGSFSQDLPAKRLARMYGVNHFIVCQVMPGLGRDASARPGIQSIFSNAMLAATKQFVRGSLDVIQRYTAVGPRTGVAMNAMNAVLDQRFTGDINILPGNGVFSVGKLLSMLSEEEMVALLKAGERATWSKVPMIRTTTRIGRTLDKILLTFEVDDAHWLRSGPRTDAVRKKASKNKKSSAPKTRVARESSKAAPKKKASPKKSAVRTNVVSLRPGKQGRSAG
jgi:NTE family protein